MIDPDTCDAAEATLSDAIGQLMEVGHDLAVVMPAAGATAGERARKIGGIAEDVVVLARALDIMWRRGTRGGG